jgi:hypothetical protein
MKTLRLLVFLIPLCFTSCEKIDSDTPDCIKKLIRTQDGLGLCESGAFLNLYSFQSQNVYVFDPGSCGADMAATVFSENCEKLGILGGFAGNTKINGVEFGQVAVKIKTLWKD